MSEISKPQWESQELYNDVVAAAREGYENLQWFWGEMLGLLSAANIDQDLLSRLIKINDNSKDSWERYISKPILAYALMNINFLFEPLEDQYNMEIVKNYIGENRINFSRALRNKSILSEPLFKQMNCKVSDDFTVLHEISIINQSGSDIKETSIHLDSGGKKIASVFQLTRDEVLFPRPDPRRTKLEPSQYFKLDMKETGPSYRFNYEVSPRNYATGVGHMEKAMWAASRNSFTPYEGFSLPSAIRNACSFQSVTQKQDKLCL